ncbi:MAG: AI-2E family transporter [Eubacterium sp.]|nr:AI-2E family transporter [Eubacterium sp.]MCI9410572.1 AI-2E family transporter [Eubacterium sp.]
MAKNSKTNKKIKETLKGLLANSGRLILIVAACSIVIAVIMHWESVMVELSRLIKVLMPFILGIVLAFLINPLVGNVHQFLNHFIFKDKRQKGCKYTSVALSYLILLGVLTVTIVYIVPQISESLKELTRSLGYGYNYVINNTAEIQQKYPVLPMEDIKQLLLKVVPENIFGYGTDLAKFVFPYLYNLSASFIKGFIDVIFGIVISCYIILDKEKISKQIRRVIYAFTNKKQAPVIWDTFRECNHIFNGFLYGKTIDSLIIGVLSLIVMSVIQLPYGLLLSVIVGVTNMIPYFGPFIGAIPGVIIYLVIEPKYAIIYVIMILVLQQFDGLYLGPKILGDLTGIKPLWVIFGITVGGAYFGVLGMFLGVPTVAVVMHIVNVIMEKKIKKRMMQEYKNN